jgi:hypothetical protein
MSKHFVLPAAAESHPGQPIAFRYRDYLPISRLWSMWKFSTVRPAKVEDREIEALRSAADYLALQERAERAEAELALERDLRKLLEARVATPDADDWFESVRIEAAQQIDRWGGADYHPAENSRRLVLLISYLTAKALDAAAHDNADKAKRYTINTGAALLNWFRALSGEFSGRPIRRSRVKRAETRV